MAFLLYFVIISLSWWIAAHGGWTKEHVQIKRHVVCCCGSQQWVAIICFSYFKRNRNRNQVPNNFLGAITICFFSTHLENSFWKEGLNRPQLFCILCPLKPHNAIKWKEHTIILILDFFHFLGSEVNKFIIFLYIILTLVKSRLHWPTFGQTVSTISYQAFMRKSPSTNDLFSKINPDLYNTV